MAAFNHRRRLSLTIAVYMKQRNNYLNRRKRILTSIYINLMRRRKVILSLLTAINAQSTVIADFVRPKEVLRSCRRRIRNSGWWDVVWNTYDDERFKQTFRLSKDTFNHVLSHIRERITKEILLKNQYVQK